MLTIILENFLKKYIREFFKETQLKYGKKN